jgi:hypothetical protein
MKLWSHTPIYSVRANPKFFAGNLRLPLGFINQSSKYSRFLKKSIK